MHSPTENMAHAWTRRAALAVLLLAALPALAQFSMVPAPQTAGAAKPSAATDDKAYRTDAARHLYAAFPMRIMRGKMPPLLYSVMAVETEIDATGQVVNVSVVRKPAADEVAPWVVAMIKRAAPFPAPAAAGAGTVRYFEIWLVDKSGLFQLDTLTEGQR
jgi:periplasmic protein TonB